MYYSVVIFIRVIEEAKYGRDESETFGGKSETLGRQEDSRRDESDVGKV